ncbi:MAG: dynamin family protein [Dolichospermum sp. WA123]|nr:dynamin family protein [Dolichospermum sp. WA123]
MSNNLLQPDSDALHQSAIDVITHVGNVMSEGCAILREHDRLLAENQSGNRLGAEIKAIEEDIRHVNEKLERVKRKELTMTIVAPTSAGKSTIINAIAGQDLLPSRKDAMTVLPTEIVFSREVTRPKLILDKALMTLLREAWRQLHQKLQRIGLEEAIKQATKNDFARKNVIKEIFNSSVFPLSEEVKPDDIQPALIKINDLLRLCGIFGISTEFLSSLSEIPRIEVPFPPELSSLEDLGLGTLVLVDTPGPSEDKSLNLVKVVEDRLKKSSLILVVIDSEKIGQTDPAKVKKLVDEIAADKGRDRISIIINRIDTRKKGDLTTEETLNLVQTQYEITKDRIFETSALRAFLATNFQREKKIFEPTELRKSEGFKSLGEAYYGDSWEDRKEDISLSEMDKASDKYWQKSGFADFMEKAIAPLVPSIKDALNDISQIFTSFLSCLSKQKGILERHIQQLQEQINFVEAELKEVISIYTSLKWQEEFLSSINSIFNESQEKKHTALHDFESESEFQKFFDHQLDILCTRLIKLNIAEDSRHYLVIINPTYINVSMLQEIVNFNRICCIKINKIFDELFDQLKNIESQYVEDVNYYLNSDNVFIHEIHKRMQKELNQEFLLNKDKYTDFYQYAKEVVKKKCNAYEANISKYEERLKKYESSSTIVGNAKIYWGEDLPDFINTGYVSYDPMNTLNPYRHHSYQNSTLIEISSRRLGTKTVYVYLFSEEVVSGIRSSYIDKESSFVSVINLYFHSVSEDELKKILVSTLGEDITIILWNRYHLFKEYEEYLRQSIETSKKIQNSYAIFVSQYNQFLGKTANLEKDLKYLQKYFDNIK